MHVKIRKRIGNPTLYNAKINYSLQSGGLVFMWKLSPPISPPVRCGILLQFAVLIKRKTADND